MDANTPILVTVTALEAKALGHLLDIATKQIGMGKIEGIPMAAAAHSIFTKLDEAAAAKEKELTAGPKVLPAP